MSGIGAVPTAKSQLPVEEHEPSAGDARKRPRPPRKPKSDADLVEVEQHKLDVEV